MVIIVADAVGGADGRDGVCDRRMHPDDPASGAAFTTEGNLDTHDPQEGLRAPQAAGKRAGVFGPAGTVPVNAVSAATGAGTQKVGGIAPKALAAGLHSRLQDTEGGVCVSIVCGGDGGLPDRARADQIRAYSMSRTSSAG
jgi:hypothetical protein